MGNIAKLTVSGKVKATEGREFTRLIGGFGDNKPTITARQVAELLDYKNGAGAVNLIVARNLDKFEVGVHMIDLKSEISERNKEYATKMLKDLGYTQNAINRSKNIYVFSQAGFLLLLKFAEGNKAVDLYKNFVEDYFQTKVQAKVMGETIQKEINTLMEDKANLLGRACMEKDELSRLGLLKKSEDITKKIVDLEKALSKDNTIKELAPKLHIANTLEECNNCFTIGSLAKVLNLNGMGRNKLYEWLRDNKILMKNNEPYQRHMQYFAIAPDLKAKGISSNVTMLRASGVEYVVKRLIEDGKVVTKAMTDILKELKSDVEDKDPIYELVV